MSGLEMSPPAVSGPHSTPPSGTMRTPARLNNGDRQIAAQSLPRTETIDWYSEGQSRTVVIGDQEIHVRFVGRKGRRGRIVISAPAGARFVEC